MSLKICLKYWLQSTPPSLPAVKNLLLKQKKRDQFYLYLTDRKRVNFKSLADQLEIARSRLNFASEEELENLLGVVSGMVTPLALMHDTKNEVEVLLDADLQQLPEISAHPNINTATILMSYQNLVKVLEKMGHTPKVIYD